MKLRAPFPWFGGKSRAAPLIWSRLGQPRNLVLPFFGSGAELFGRPGWDAVRGCWTDEADQIGVETVNDKDCYVSNFWRALQSDPEAVAYYADWPVNEADLHARHRWLVRTGAERVERLMSDPEYFDAQVAGWWVWGLCCWIGSGWCSRAEWTGMVNAGRAARGIHAAAVHRKRPVLAHGVGVRGVQRTFGKRPALTGNGGGVGVRRPGLDAPTRKIPQLGGGSKGVNAQLPSLRGDSAAGQGIHASGFEARTGGLLNYFLALRDRLRRVRVCCGDFERVLGPAVTTCIGITGVVLDPPYDVSRRARDLYREDDRAESEQPVWERARAWALANGDNPLLRIAICGYAGEHNELVDAGWTCVAWKASGGYGRSARGRANAHAERIWFSPNCLSPEAPHQMPLFAEAIQ